MEETPAPKRRRLRQKTTSPAFDLDDAADDKEQDEQETGSAWVASPRARRRDIRGAYVGLSGKEFRALQRLKLPAALFCILHYLSSAPVVQDRDLDHVEFFSGQGMVNKAFSDLGMNAAGFDYIQDPILQNMMTTGGYINALQWCRRLRRCAHAHFGTVCSSWVWMSRASTLRSKANPMGDRTDASDVFVRLRARADHATCSSRLSPLGPGPHKARQGTQAARQERERASAHYALPYGLSKLARTPRI